MNASADRPPTGVLIMDDAIFARDSLRALLEELPDVVVSASSASVVEASHLVRETLTDVVIVAPHQLDPSGAATVRAVKRMIPSARVIVVSTCQRPTCRQECLSSGADAFIDRTVLYSRIRDLLHAWFDSDAGTSDSKVIPG